MREKKEGNLNLSKFLDDCGFAVNPNFFQQDPREEAKRRDKKTDNNSDFDPCTVAARGEEMQHIQRPAK